MKFNYKRFLFMVILYLIVYFGMLFFFHVRPAILGQVILILIISAIANKIDFDGKG